MNYKEYKYINKYIQDIETGTVKASKRLKKAIKLIKKDLSKPNVYIDTVKVEQAIGVIEKYFQFNLLPWQKFIISLIHAYEYTGQDLDIVPKDTDGLDQDINKGLTEPGPNRTLLYDEFLIVMGRGNGKTGFISAVVWYLTTYIHGINKYNVDIIANNEKQAKTSFMDIFDMLETNWKKLKPGFRKTRQVISSKQTGSKIEYNTSNSTTKDGKRSACLVFDEIHAYETYENVDVFKSGFGKRPESRVFYITTNGYTRDGVLDQEVNKSDDILNGVIKDMGYLPLIYEMDDEDEAENPDLWEKANPSIEHFPDLKREMKKHHINTKYQSSTAIEFMTKRMNIPKQDNFLVVAEWEQILDTNQPIPYQDLKGSSCIGAIDYARLTDFCSVGLLFKNDNERIFIEHTFVNHKSLKKESREIKFPVDDMVEKGLITIIYDDFIRPEHLSQWFVEMGKKYNIIDIFADNYRVSVLREEFKEQGLPLDTVRSGPITHNLIAPKIEMLFADKNLILGDNKTMRWYINNTYQEMDQKGNTTYKKIEPKTRKTDGFFALLHALSNEDKLPDSKVQLYDYDLIQF